MPRTPRKTAKKKTAKKKTAKKKTAAGQKAAADALHDAVAAGNIAKVRRWLADGGSVDSRDSLKRTPLHIAAERGRTEIAVLLLEHGATVDAKDYRKFTPLHRAAGRGDLTTTKRLLERGASARARSVFDDTPLHTLAVHANKAPKGGADPMVELIELLVAAGCPVDARESAGRTALWFAAATDPGLLPSAAILKVRLTVLKTLLKLGADPKLASNTNPPIRPVEAARGLHQSRKYRVTWPEAVALLS